MFDKAKGLSNNPIGAKSNNGKVTESKSYEIFIDKDK